MRVFPPVHPRSGVGGRERRRFLQVARHWAPTFVRRGPIAGRSPLGGLRYDAPRKMGSEKPRVRASNSAAQGARAIFRVTSELAAGLFV